MQEELSKRLHNAEAEIERLQGEVAALSNVLVGVLRDTFIEKPEVVERMFDQLREEITRLEEAPERQFFRKEGAQRFYGRFMGLVKDSIDADRTSS